MVVYHLRDHEQSELRRLLQAVFDGPEDFDEFLQYRLNERLWNIAGPTDTFPRALLRVIRRADAKLWWPSLVVEARRAVPDDVALLTFAARHGLASTIVADGQEIEDAGHVEATVKRGGETYDAVEWLACFQRVGGQVCRIDVGGRSGTGFLVGPETVLTNHHVVSEVLDGDVGPAEVRLIFDYKSLPDGLRVSSATVVRLAADWLVDASPHSAQDAVPDSGTDPEPDQLDFALLRLARRLGDEPIEGAEAGPRGWVRVPAQAHDFARHRAITIVQHPDRRPLKFAVETNAVVRVNQNRTRVRYTTTTAGGSSGSPCFTMDWRCVALHRGTEATRRGQLPRFNVGVPVAAIRRLTAARGTDAAFAS
ncbi:hypothetical protein L3i22_058860 [Actinoplanes sp. L3-i22]|nr:hypothetical protein L3i22_058860 [Actinoplanes sp. L3-i22]